MSQASEAQSGGEMILVVDDFVDAREMYCEYLAFSGFRTAEASNGQEAVERAVELRPDLILMDLSLPVLDGRIAVQSQVGRGSTFTLTLPLKGRK